MHVASSRFVRCSTFMPRTCESGPQHAAAKGVSHGVLGCSIQYFSSLVEREIEACARFLLRTQQEFQEPQDRLAGYEHCFRRWPD